MNLTGHKRSAGKRSGGIRSLALIACDDVRAVSFDYRGTGCLRVIPRQGCQLRSYEFKEDTAFYQENLTDHGGAVVVEHKLSFMLEKMDENSLKSVDEIARVSAEGIIAIACSQNGVKYLIGASKKFGTERPLRLISCSGTTAEKPGDDTGEIVVLSSEDTCKASIYLDENP